MKNKKPQQFPDHKNILTFLKNGGDRNMQVDGVFLGEYLINHEDTHEIDIPLHDILKNKDWILRPEKIQDGLYYNSMYIKYEIKGKENKKTMINRYDFKNHLMTSQQGPYKSCKRDYISSWLGFFFAGWKSLNLVIDAYHYHPDFKESLKLKNKHEMNPWQCIAYFSVNRLSNDKKDYENVLKIFEILMETCPEGLREKNQMGETTLEMAKKRCHRDSDGGLDPQFEKMIKILEQYDLVAALDEKLPPKKQKINKGKI